MPPFARRVLTRVLIGACLVELTVPATAASARGQLLVSMTVLASCGVTTLPAEAGDASAAWARVDCPPSLPYRVSLGYERTSADNPPVTRLDGHTLFGVQQLDRSAPALSVRGDAARQPVQLNIVY